MVNSRSRQNTRRTPDEPPPVLGTWRRMYAVVIINTLVVYLALWLFSHYAAR